MGKTKSSVKETRRTPEEGYAARFKRLLKAFPRADGESWRPTEIEHATGGLVSRSYVCAIAKGKIKSPGVRRLSYIADVIGFPETLWYKEPRLWDEELDLYPNRVGLRSLRTAQSLRTATPDPYEGVLVPPPPVGRELAAMVEALFARYSDPQAGKRYEEREIASRSGGRLTAQEVRLMRIGQQVQVPRWEDMMALADAFGISLVHWFSEEDRPLALDVDGMIRVLEDDLVRAYFGDQAPSMSDRHLVAWMMRLARGDISNVMVGDAGGVEKQPSKVDAVEGISGESGKEGRTR